MNTLLLFLGSIFIVFALGYQQHNVHYRHYQAAFVNGIFIGIMNLLLRLEPSASTAEMAVFLIGGSLGTSSAKLAGDQMPMPSVAKGGRAQ